MNREGRVETPSLPEEIERKWTTFSFDEVEEICNTFIFEIKEGAPVTIEQIRMKMRTSKGLTANNPGYIIKCKGYRKSRKSNALCSYLGNKNPPLQQKKRLFQRSAQST